jgi:membrane fusion protein (multidrug efflux system)
MEMTRISTVHQTSDKMALAKRMGIMLASVLLIGGAMVTYKMLGVGQTPRQAPAPDTVSVAPAQTIDWAPELSAVGSLRAVNGADLAFEVSGIIEEINFNSGENVAAGAVLVRLRDADERAKLQSLQATAQLAQITYNRNMELSRTQNVSQATLDANNANLKNAQALLTQQQALLDKKTIRAPFAGSLGLRAVDRGQYVNAGTPIVTLQALDPIFVDFYLPQQSLDQIKAGQAVTAKVDTYPDLEFKGTIAAFNPKVDPTNRNVQVRASLQNPEHKMFPGMYATVKIAAGQMTRQVVIPQSSVTYSPYGDAVYVIDSQGEKQTARYVFVTLGEKRGDLVVVESGVKEGDNIVTAGMIKLRNGATVRIDNSVQPSMDLQPKTANP